MSKEMTVKQLIDQLADMPEDAIVKFTYNARDYWRTTVAKDIQSVEEGQVIYSEYHSMDKVVDDEEYDRTDRKDLKAVVLLG